MNISLNLVKVNSLDEKAKLIEYKFFVYKERQSRRNFGLAGVLGDDI